MRNGLIIVRLGRGIHEHFHIRLSEWIMVYPALGMWFAFQYQPEMFSTSPSFETLRHWANEHTWGVLCLWCGVARLIALTVNGTFRAFSYSPHMRIAASFIGVAFWSQFSLGFLTASLAGNGAFSAVVAFSTFCLLELANVYRSWSDIGVQRSRGSH